MRVRNNVHNLQMEVQLLEGIADLSEVIACSDIRLDFGSVTAQDSGLPTALTLTIIPTAAKTILLGGKA